MVLCRVNCLNGWFLHGVVSSVRGHGDETCHFLHLCHLLSYSRILVTTESSDRELFSEIETMYYFIATSVYLPSKVFTSPIEIKTGDTMIFILPFYRFFEE